MTDILEQLKANEAEIRRDERYKVCVELYDFVQKMRDDGVGDLRIILHQLWEAQVEAGKFS